MNPFLIPTAVVKWVQFWWRVWTRFVPPKLMIGATALVAVIMVAYIGCTGG